MKKLSKQRLRSRISAGASYAEIYLTALILIGVLIFSIDIIKDLYLLIKDFPDINLSIDTFLAHVLSLIIAIEFIKMLAKHTPGSAIDVVLFAIARKLIVQHGTMLDSLIGVVAIAILFAIRRYLTVSIVQSGMDGSLINGGMTIQEFNEAFKTNLESSMGFTIGGIIANHAKEYNEKIDAGYMFDLGDRKIEVYSMDDHLIKQVKVFEHL